MQQEELVRSVFKLLWADTHRQVSFLLENHPAAAAAVEEEAASFCFQLSHLTSTRGVAAASAADRAITNDDTLTSGLPLFRTWHGAAPNATDISNEHRASHPHGVKNSGPRSSPSTSLAACGQDQLNDPTPRSRGGSGRASLELQHHEEMRVAPSPTQHVGCALPDSGSLPSFSAFANRPAATAPASAREELLMNTECRSDTEVCDNDLVIFEHSPTRRGSEREHDPDAQHERDPKSTDDTIMGGCTQHQSQDTIQEEIVVTRINEPVTSIPSRSVAATQDTSNSDLEARHDAAAFAGYNSARAANKNHSEELAATVGERQSSEGIGNRLSEPSLHDRIITGFTWGPIQTHDTTTVAGLRDGSGYARQSTIQLPVASCREQRSATESNRQSSKEQTLRTTTKDAASAHAFSELSPGLSLPQEVSVDIAKSLPRQDSRTYGILMRLFACIGSPDAICRLRQACLDVRANTPSFAADTTSVGSIMRTLDTLDNHEHITAMLRRYHLAQLVRFRNLRQDYHLGQNDPSNARTLKHGYVKQKAYKTNRGKKIAATKALADLLSEAYPSLSSVERIDGYDASVNQRVTQEYRRKHALLKSRLTHGRNWYLMQQRFSPGILALLCVHSSENLRNYDIESLPEATFTVFLDILERYRGSFLRAASASLSTCIFDILLGRSASELVLENSDSAALASAPLDSEWLSYVCTVV